LHGNLTRSKDVEIALLGKGEIFGEEELFGAVDSGCREYTCVANSIKLEVLVIPRSDFLRRVSGAKAKAFFTKQCQNKERLRSDRLKALTTFHQG
jgi:CRP-like cAMP-binding protein